jgi:hypothetical protein
MTASRQLRLAARDALLICTAFFGTGGAAWAHEGGLGNEVMWRACDGRQIDDACSFESVDHDVFRGTCQSMSKALVCVRNEPIERAANPTRSHVKKAE